MFVPLPGGTRLVGTTDARVRGGVTGLADQAFGLALQRTYHVAMAKLPQVAAAHSGRGSA